MDHKLILWSSAICAILLVAALLLLPGLIKAKKKPQKKTVKKHDSYRLLPQDKGKIIKFPKK